MRAVKHPSDSYTTQVQVLTQEHMNGCGRLFGGRLMSFMDIVAAVTARRHSARNVTTVRVDGLEFHLPARANDTLVLTGKVAYTGRTSMYVRVIACIESLNGRREITDSAWFVMVALDEHDRPTEVPELVPETEEEKRDWAEAKAMKESLKKSR